MKPACREISEMLSDYDTPACTAAEKKLIDAHLANCPDCQQALEKQRQLVAELKKSADQLQPKTPLFQVPLQKSEPTVTQKSGNLFEFFFGWKFSSFALGMTSFVLILLLIWHFNTGRPTAQQPGQPATKMLALAQGSYAKHNDHLYICRSDVSIKTSAFELKLKPETIFAILSENEIKLENGHLFCEIEPLQDDFKILTPHAVIKVTGTEFSLTVSSFTTCIDLQQGSLQISNRNGQIDLVAPAVAEFLANGTYKKVKTASDNQVIKTSISDKNTVASATIATSSEQISEIETPKTPATPKEFHEEPATPENQNNSITSPEDTLLGD